MKAIYLNDNSCLPHIGCKAVHDAHIRLFEHFNISVSWSFFKNDLWFYKKFSFDDAVSAISRDLGKVINSADCVIVNGEGTLHHGNGKDLLAFMKAAKRFHKPVYLINALIQNMGDYADVLASCDGIMARDILSYEEALKYNSQVSLSPDSIVFARFGEVCNFDENKQEAANFPCKEVLITDCIGGTKGKQWKKVADILHRYDNNAVYFPLKNEFFSGQWKQALQHIASAKCIVTGRHHGCYLAMLLGKPFVLLDSNSHKMQGIRAQYGDFIEICESADEVEAAIGRATKNVEKFQAIAQSLKAFDMAEAYAAFFVNRAHSGVRDLFANFLKSNPASSDWNSYAITLLRLNSLNDARVLTLSHFLMKFSATRKSYSTHRVFWDSFFKLIPDRPFLKELLSSCYDNVVDPDLKACFVDIFGSHEIKKDAVLLDPLACSPISDRNVFTQLYHQGRMLEFGYYFYRNPVIAASRFVTNYYRTGRYSDVMAIGDFYDFLDHQRVLLQYANSCFKQGSIEKSLNAVAKIDDKELQSRRTKMLGQLLLQRSQHMEGWNEFREVLNNSHYREMRDRMGQFKGAGDKTSILIVFCPHEGLGGQLMFSRILQYYIEKNCFSKLGIVIERRLAQLFREKYSQIEVFEHESADFSTIARHYDDFYFAREILSNALNNYYDRAISSISTCPPFKGEKISGLLQGGRKRIAFSWTTTNPSSSDFRSVPAQELACSLKKFDFDFYPLQHGDTETDMKVFRDVLGDRFKESPVKPAANVNEILSFLSEMDVVITIDNSLLHMAGSINKLCFGLLSIPCYWQWPLTGKDSFWYPSLRLVRQKVPGFWEDALKELEETLHAHIKNGLI